MRQNIRWYFALIFLFLLSFVPLTEASAAPQLEVKASAGFQNKVKFGVGLPLTLTVVNNGDEFSGDLVIDYSESYAVGSAKAIPFTIGKGETKTLNLSLPSLSDEYTYSGLQTQLFYFYQDGWESGKEVKYKGSKNVKPNYHEVNSNFILTLSDSADRVRPVSTIRLTSMPDTQVIHVGQLKDFHFPTDAEAYGMANFLVVDEYVLADLPEDAQKAILQWVQSGGVVIAGASDNTNAEMGLLSTYLPLALTDERTQIRKEIFTNFTNSKDFTADIPAFKSSLTDQSSMIVSSANLPVAASKKVGEGAIIQTAFSLGDEPFSKEAGATAFLTELIRKANIGSISNSSIVYGQGVNERLSYEVGEVNELFPSFQVSTKLLIGIVIVYVILVGPLLYFLLKRRDKREHAWWIIPAISVLAAIAIFAYGAKDRLVRPQIQQSSFYEVQEDSSLSGYYVESMLSNRSGDFQFESAEGTSIVASKRNIGFTGGPGDAKATSILEEHANKDQLTMRDVGYWSVSTVLGESLIENVGKFDVDLTVENGNVRGTVKNGFPFAINDVAIWSGTKMIGIGNISPNESIKVAEPIGGALLLPIAPINGSQYMGFSPQLKASDLPKERKNSLIRMSQTLGNKNTQPAIVGHTEDAIVPVSLVDARAEMSAVNVIYQTFEPETIFSGEFTLPASSMDMAVAAEDPSSHLEPMIESKFEWFMSNGSYTYDWQLPANLPLKQVRWTELQLANTNTANISVEIFNMKSNAFEPVKSGRFSIKENVENYISDEGKVQFKVNKQASNGDDYTRLPELRLKGEVIQ